MQTSHKSSFSDGLSSWVRFHFSQWNHSVVSVELWLHSWWPLRLLFIVIKFEQWVFDFKKAGCYRTSLSQNNRMANQKLFFMAINNFEIPVLFWTFTTLVESRETWDISVEKHGTFVLIHSWVHVIVLLSVLTESNHKPQHHLLLHIVYTLKGLQNNRMNELRELNGCLQSLLHNVSITTLRPKLHIHRRFCMNPQKLLLKYF